MQQMCSVDHPVAGEVLQSRVLSSGSRIRLDSLVRLGVEFEIRVRVGKALSAARTAPYDLADVAAAVDAVAPAFEVIDDRNSAYPLDLLSLVADNAWNEGIVVGAFRIGLARSGGRARGGGIERPRHRRRPRTRRAGPPLRALAWLAQNNLSAQGESLPAGAIVSTGSLVTTRFPKVVVLPVHRRRDRLHLDRLRLTVCVIQPAFQLSRCAAH